MVEQLQIRTVSFDTSFLLKNDSFVDRVIDVLARDQIACFVTATVASEVEQLKIWGHEDQPETNKQFVRDEISNLTPELNVIGQRVDPALSLIERYLNDASMAGLNQVKIIHGIGTGILSRAIRDYLKGHPLVENSRKGTEDEGGEAVTIIAL